jgi:hypothetical protein
LVVGFTHKSIDNLLKKLVEIIRNHAPNFPIALTFPIGRIVTEDTTDPTTEPSIFFYIYFSFSFPFLLSFYFFLNEQVNPWLW